MDLSGLPHNIQILIYYDILYESATAEAVAKLFGISEGRVRSAASEARRSREGQLALIKYRTLMRNIESPSKRRIRRVIEESVQTLEEAQNSQSEGYAVFVSDIHFPHQEMKCLDLTLRIIEDLQPVYVSVLNDALDFPTISRWEDRRDLDEQAFDTDIDNVLKLNEQWIDAINNAADTNLVAIMGNHTTRLGNIPEKGGRDYLIANIMERMHDRGVLFNTPITQENMFRINRDLVWMHGISAAKNASTVARKNLEQAKTYFDTRWDMDVVYGHTHRPNQYQHGMAYGFNSGCLCDMNPHYLKNKPRWGWGITVSRIFDDTHETQLVNFIQTKRGLAAYYNGKEYKI